MRAYKFKRSLSTTRLPAFAVLAAVRFGALIVLPIAGSEDLALIGQTEDRWA
jgi:hypothetical protein